LGISTNTVGSRLSKCLNKLHNELRHRPLFERTNS
jgi:DNA-directed RNA polymerase specialized sigma24 family protein